MVLKQRNIDGKPWELYQNRDELSYKKDYIAQIWCWSQSLFASVEAAKEGTDWSHLISLVLIYVV